MPDLFLHALITVLWKQGDARIGDTSLGFGKTYYYFHTKETIVLEGDQPRLLVGIVRLGRILAGCR
jgi:hypothetical protein